MPIVDAVIVAATVAAFVIFAGVLAWAGACGGFDHRLGRRAHIMDLFTSEAGERPIVFGIV